MSHITNARMESFREVISAQVNELLEERGDDMLRAWNENIEEAHTNEGKFPPLKIALGVTVDIEAAKIETMIGFSVKYSSKVSAPIEDPDQMKLPGFVASMDKNGVKVEIAKQS